MIAPIGKETDHVKTWLREESRGIHRLWLIHSPKSNKDFPAIARKLEKDLLHSYDKLVIKKKIIDDALSVNPTIDAIYDIILQEEENDPLLVRPDFAINITGGTNAMGAAALLSATLYGTKAYYIREEQKGDPPDQKYVDELPVLPIGIARLNKNQLTVLKIISDSTYEIEGGPPELDSKPIKGSITRTKLLEKLKWDKSIRNSKFTRKEGNTRLLGISKKLIEANLINKIPYTEIYENRAVKTTTVIVDGYVRKIEDKNIPDHWVIKKNEKEIRFEITPAGRRQG